MEPQQPGREKRLFSWRKAFKLITASDEDSLHSSGLDSANSGDDADLIQGRDPSYDIVDDDDEEEVGVSSLCTPEGGRGGGRSRSPANRGSRSETLPGDAPGWRTKKEPDILPHPLPHFLPKRRTGVQPPLSQYVDNPSPSELLRMYFHQAAIKTLCANTNKNAAKILLIVDRNCHKTYHSSPGAIEKKIFQASDICGPTQ
ncbi:uncharacterized protein LOC125886588 isoform X1 [Epinephelus fuscoguttatus]|uniref:uncharacterized protein LOC125886588 isoform X1 n=1 Tax=Epinephelus fuscoguttatus TaxID=293821 RepID=UPI0020D0401A|nr:uncharacterized protein LOC125886588 isoform X1 [Epinephelus fuscoguttatus]